MDARFAWLLAFGALVLSVDAQVRFETPPFPPKDWSVRISLRVSDDIALTFLERKPAKNEYVYVDSIGFSLQSDGALTAPRKHLLLTGKPPSSNFAEHETAEKAIAYLPVTDQRTLYENAIAALNAFAFTNDIRGKSWELSGVDISLHLDINHREASIEYRNLQPHDLPEGLRASLAILRRNLPAEYTKLFDFLKVPKLASLPAEEAGKYAKCRVHDQWMRVEEVPISYGFPAARQKYWDAAKELFPNAWYFLPGGCVVTPGSPPSAKTLYCASCRAAEKKWREENEPNEK